MVRAVLKKRVSRKTRLKFWVETPDTPQEKREIKEKTEFIMYPFASYSRRFKLNFKPQKTPIFWKIYTGVAP